MDVFMSTIGGNKNTPINTNVENVENICFNVKIGFVVSVAQLDMYVALLRNAITVALWYDGLKAVC